MADPTIGPIVHGGHVEIAARDTLRAWMPWMLARVDEDDGRDITDPAQRTAPPRTYDVASDNQTRWLEETPPALLVICPGTSDEPTRNGRQRSYSVWWELHVLITTGGGSENGARALAYKQAAAVVRVLTQVADLGGAVNEIRWLGDRTDPLPRGRRLMACESLFVARTARALDTVSDIPDQPPADVTDFPARPTIAARRSTVTRTPPHLPGTP